MNETPEGKVPRGAPGFALLAVAFLMWVMAPVALLPPPAGQRGWTTAALPVVGEGAFWVSAVVLGREVVRRYRAHLDPRRLFGRKNP